MILRWFFSGDMKVLVLKVKFGFIVYVVFYSVIVGSYVNCRRMR